MNQHKASTCNIIYSYLSTHPAIPKNINMPFDELNLNQTFKDPHKHILFTRSLDFPFWTLNHHYYNNGFDEASKPTTPIPRST